MHEQIMRAINPFYEGKLECGLDSEPHNGPTNNTACQSGRKDDYGLENKGSELIHPRRHMYWIDSSLTRNNTYCAEKKRGYYLRERAGELPSQSTSSMS